MLHIDMRDWEAFAASWTNSLHEEAKRDDGSYLSLNRRLNRAQTNKTPL